MCLLMYNIAHNGNEKMLMKKKDRVFMYYLQIM